MANLNKVMLIGNLTRDPKVRYTPKGTAVADISIAVNRAWTDDSGEKKEEVTFVDATLFGRLAEIAQEYLKKGRQAFIEGRLQLDSWTDKQTGQKRSRLRVVAENLQMLGSRGDNEGGSRPTAPPPTQQRQTSAPPMAAPRHRTNPKDPDLDAEPDEIPF